MSTRYLTTLVAITLLAVVGAAHAEFLGFGKKEPISLDDARAVVQKLRPASRGGSTDVSVYVWGDGQIRVSLWLQDGTDVVGRGGDLKAAVEDLTKNLDGVSADAKSAADAARAILNQGRASQ